MGIVAVTEERDLIAIARDLGAERFGGMLSAAEKRILVSASSTATSRAILGSLRDLIRRGKDPLGEALCVLRPGVERRNTGTFYTPSFIVRPMVAWALKHKPQRVVDAGCGSGRFTARVLLESPQMPIIAVDTDPVATILTRAVLAVLKAPNGRVVNGDYLRFSVPLISGGTAYVGNPPYVRHHDLSVDVKARASATAASLGHTISGLAGLHALFFLATAALARRGDVGCFVTSAEWMDTNYGSIVRDLMTNGLGGHGIHVYSANTVAFEDAQTTAAISYFHVGSEPTHLSFALSDEPRSRRALGSGAVSIPRDLLLGAKRWSPLLKTGGAEHGDNIPRLRQIARVHRGAATGGNEFFVMTKRRAKELGINRFCVPVITRAKEIQDANGMIRDNKDRMVVLTIPAETDRSKHPALDAYLKTGEKRNGSEPAISDRWVTSHRTPWYSFAVPRPKIVATYMARSAVRFAYNPDGLALLNVGHGIFPTSDLNDSQVQNIVEVLNHLRETFVGMGRTYHGGLEKFEPREMEQLPIPANLAILSPG
jgi:predicted RNA methylase